MRTLLHTFEYDDPKTYYTLHPLFDIHYGAAACDEAMLASRVDEIRRDPNALVVLGGDNLEAITRKDPRSSEYTLAPWLYGEEDTVGIARDQLVKAMAPIADKVVAIAEGNHENTVLRHNNRDIYWSTVEGVARYSSHLPQEIGIGYEGFLRLRFVKQNPSGSSGPTFTSIVYIHHGWGGGRKKGGKANKLADFMGVYDADLYLMGHVHDIIYVTQSYVKAGTGRGSHYKQRERHGLICGTALQSYLTGMKSNGKPRNTYGQMAGYSPTKHGWPRIRIYPGLKKYEILIPSEVG